MPTITAAEFRSVMNLPSSLSAQSLEYLLDLAIDALNFLGGDYSNLSGSAGTKSLTVESNKRFGVFAAARAIYYSFFKDITTRSIGDISVTPTDLIANPEVLKVLQMAASKSVDINVRRG